MEETQKTVKMPKDMIAEYAKDINIDGGRRYRTSYFPLNSTTSEPGNTVTFRIQSGMLTLDPYASYLKFKHTVLNNTNTAFDALYDSNGGHGCIQSIRVLVGGGQQSWNISNNIMCSVRHIYYQLQMKMTYLINSNY